MGLLIKNHHGVRFNRLIKLVSFSRKDSQHLFLNLKNQKSCFKIFSGSLTKAVSDRNAALSLFKENNLIRLGSKITCDDL